MSRYEKFLSDLSEYTSMYYDFNLEAVRRPAAFFFGAHALRGVFDIQGPQILEGAVIKTPNEIRKARILEDKRDYITFADWNSIVNWFGPSQLAIRTPSWMWHLMAEVLWRRDPYELELANPDTLLTFDPLAEKRPGMYAYEKRILWDTFSGLPVSSPAPRISLSTFVEPSVFHRSATAYLHYIISIGQAVYKAGLAATDGTCKRTAVGTEAAGDTKGPHADAAAGAAVDVSTSVDHHGTA